MASGPKKASPYGHPWLTYGLCLAMFVTHLTVEWSRESLAIVDQASAAHRLDLLARGAKSVALVADAGESWRIFSAHFVHTSWVHLTFNVAFLLPVGGALELVLRRADYALLLATIACTAGMFSLAWTPEISAGGSGLVYGTLASAVLIGLRHSRQMGRRLRMHFGLWVLPFLLIILAIGANNPHLDHYNHLGGLVAGLVITPWLQIIDTRTAYGPQPTRQPTHPWSADEASGDAARWIICGTLVALALVMAPALARNFQAPQTHRLSGLSFWLPGGWQRSEPLRNGPVGVLGTNTVAAQPAPAASIRYGGATDLVFMEITRLPQPAATGLAKGAHRRPEAHGPGQPLPVSLAGAHADHTGAAAARCAEETPDLLGQQRSFAASARDCTQLETVSRRGVATLVFRRVISGSRGPVEFRLEMPAGWREKYRETTKAIFGSIRHDASNLPRVHSASLKTAP